MLNEISANKINEERVDYLKQGQKSSTTSSKKKIVDGYHLESSAVGRRKTSIADVSVSKGVGKFVINSVDILNYFPRLEDRKQVLFPLSVTGCLGKFDICAQVQGGGSTGQLLRYRIWIRRGD